SQQPQAATASSRQPPRQTPTIARRPVDGSPAATDLNKPVTTKDGAPKVLSIGADTSKPKAKVLSIGGTAVAPPAAKKETPTPAPAEVESGAKVTAAKAIERAEKTT